MPLNDLKEGEGAKLDTADAVIVGGVPRLALTISRFSSCLLSPSERGLLALLVELTFMTSFPACPCSSVRIQVYCQGAKVLHCSLSTVDMVCTCIDIKMVYLKLFVFVFLFYVYFNLCNVVNLVENMYVIIFQVEIVQLMRSQKCYLI